MQKPDPRPGDYFVSATDAGRYGLLSGPYDTHEDALAAVDSVMATADRLDPRAWFWAWGTCRLAPDSGRVGILQQRGTLPPPNNLREGTMKTVLRPTERRLWAIQEPYANAEQCLVWAKDFAQAFCLWFCGMDADEYRDLADLEVDMTAGTGGWLHIWVDDALYQIKDVTDDAAQLTEQGD